MCVRTSKLEQSEATLVYQLVDKYIYQLLFAGDYRQKRIESEPKATTTDRPAP